MARRHVGVSVHAPASADAITIATRADALLVTPNNVAILGDDDRMRITVDPFGLNKELRAIVGRLPTEPRHEEAGDGFGDIVQ
jgi:hypothetical protein